MKSVKLSVNNIFSGNNKKAAAAKSKANKFLNSSKKHALSTRETAKVKGGVTIFDIQGN